MNRQVALDTETTGLNAQEGHRIIEVAAVALLDREISGSFHQLLNPQRAIDKEAIAIHRIDDKQLQEQPLFGEICDSLLDFVRGSQLIIHNASFDLGFLDAELKRIQRRSFLEESGCKVIDTMELATEQNLGTRRSLDALCDYYGIDRSEREQGHSATLDAELLAKMYLAMTGGQLSMNLQQEAEIAGQSEDSYAMQDAQTLLATPAELQAHESFMKMLQENTKAKKLPSF